MVLKKGQKVATFAPRLKVETASLREDFRRQESAIAGVRMVAEALEGLDDGIKGECLREAAQVIEGFARKGASERSLDE
jgi:hypothetical protein